MKTREARIFVHSDGFARVSRVTVEVPGYQPVRQWMLVHCNRDGALLHPVTPVVILAHQPTRVEVEIEMQRLGRAVANIVPV